jgi:hypothetical protein
LFGNNLGLCGSRKSTAQLLRELGRVTRRDAHILCTTRAPGTLNHKHRSYWNERLAGGNEFGVVQFELGFRDKERKQVALFLIAPSNLMTLAWECGWRVQEIFAIGNPDDGYAAVLVKRRVSRGRALDF